MPHPQESEKSNNMLLEVEALLHYLATKDLASEQNGDVIIAALAGTALDLLRRSMEQPT